jgi:hypothetical protein
MSATNEAATCTRALALLEDAEEVYVSICYDGQTYYRLLRPDKDSLRLLLVNTRKVAKDV